MAAPKVQLVKVKEKIETESHKSKLATIFIAFVWIVLGGYAFLGFTWLANFYFHFLQIGDQEKIEGYLAKGISHALTIGIGIFLGYKQNDS
jgi:hypothetical protein